ncbi:MAG: YgjV family protein, partial [Oscillospiraceae bacterium]|nr:YgjV family protein [Oscillospiraceae bacterium]
MDKEIIGQIIGIIAATLAVISFQQKTHKYIVAFQLAANVAFILNFGLIGNTAGAILNGVALVRALVFVNKGRKWADNPLWLWFFCGLCIAAGWYTWTDWRTILPTLGMICTTV